MAPSLQFVGTVHDDPFGPSRLRDWLRSRSEGSHFIGVEANLGLWEDIVKQRLLIPYFANKAWPSVTADFVDPLADALFFEAAVPLASHSNVPIRWLDDGRLTTTLDGVATSTTDAVTHLAQRRVIEYKRLLEDAGMDDPRDDAERALAILHTETRKRAVEHPVQLLQPEHWSDGRYLPRDEVWAERVCSAIEREETRQVVLIVGKWHARPASGSLLTLLGNFGLRIQTFDL